MESAILIIKQKFGEQLHNIICRKVKHQEHCHDIMQEVYLKILLQLPRIENATNISAYLVRLTNNTVADHYRKSKAFEKSDLPVDFQDGSSDMLDQSLQLANCCLRPMIETLPEIYRDALIMTELEGMKQKEYAAKAGISLSNAKVRVQRAKEKLKETILECCNYEFDSYGNIVSCAEKTDPSCCKK